MCRPLARSLLRSSSSSMLRFWQWCTTSTVETTPAIDDLCSLRVEKCNFVFVVGQPVDGGSGFAVQKAHLRFKVFDAASSLLRFLGRGGVVEGGDKLGSTLWAGCICGIRRWIRCDGRVVECCRHLGKTESSDERETLVAETGDTASRKRAGGVGHTITKTP